ncbi:MAG: hypothetical protein P8J69_03660, partial [Flavobacteriaceae bacterium]|nr:hypothetical protein [Flavobacteriaceae bacterium]
MKKITFMFIFLICSVGFSQTNNLGNVPISDLGDNNPTYAQSEPRVSSNVEIIAISELGDNNPTHYLARKFDAQSEPGVSPNLKSLAISNLGDNNPTYAQSEPRVSSNVKTIAATGGNNRTYAQSEPRVYSNVETIAISNLGDNNPTYAQSEPRVSSNLETITSATGGNNRTYFQSEPRVSSTGENPAMESNRAPATMMDIPIPGTSDYKQGFENLVSIPFVPNRNSAGSDDCTGATEVLAGETYVGNTGDYNDTGGNSGPDVWYSYAGSAGDITLSLCDGGTDYDSYLRVFDACDGTQIANNDDFCSLQSELVFTADGTSTYYIMIEGYSSSSGNYSLAVSGEFPGGSDNCNDATPVFDGETYLGDTTTKTDTGGNSAPDAWYSYSGAAGDVTISLCDGGTDYDSYLRVFDACDGTQIANNDDSCSLQSELVFTADGTSTYYIMVEGYSSSSGNFSLAVSVEFSGGGGGGEGDCDDVLLEIDQNLGGICMAFISQGGIAQGYKPLTSFSAGAGFQFEAAPAEGTDLTLSLWDELPNNGGTMLTSGTTVCNGSDVWVDVFWDVV